MRINFQISNRRPLILIAGPCVMESRDHALMMAEKLDKIAHRLKIPFIFKTSFDKANRTSGDSFRGINFDIALNTLKEISYLCPVLTDVHLPDQCDTIAEVVDVLQIPAFLCRQTDLLLAAAKTGKQINIKKGQFLAPWDMKNVIDKIPDANIMLTERGTCFGYNRLVVDMTSIPIMKKLGCPIIFDGTHSVQLPGGQGTTSGGAREFVEPLCTAAVSLGIAGVFLEVHDDPDNAPSDGPNMIPLGDLPVLLRNLADLDYFVKR